MAKGDAPALRMRLDQGKLLPDSAYDQERLATYRNGSVIHVTIWQKRNEKLLRKYWAVLHRVVDACKTPWENAEEASDALKMALGITDFGHSVNGQRFLRPGSISFSTMDEAAFSDFYEKAMAVLAKVTGVDPETLSAESADVGDEQTSSEVHSPEDAAATENASSEVAADQSRAAGLQPEDDSKKEADGQPSASSSGGAEPSERQKCIDLMLKIATDATQDEQARVDELADMATHYCGQFDEETFVRPAFDKAKALVLRKSSEADARAAMADLV